MPENNHHEAEIIQARERLARAMTRLQTLVGGMSAQLERLESAREDSTKRLKENESLLERERAITKARDALTESATSELETARAEIAVITLALAERDELIRELKRSVESLERELALREETLTESVSRLGITEDSLVQLQDEHQHITVQFDRLKEERDKAMKDLRTTIHQDESFALKFTQDERLQLLKTVDAIIERVDVLGKQNGKR